MTNSRILDLAVDYVARGLADNGQFFTSPACEVFNGPPGFKCVQVWVGVPNSVFDQEQEVPNAT